MALGTLLAAGGTALASAASSAAPQILGSLASAGASAGLNSLLGSSSGGSTNGAGFMDTRAFKAFSPQIQSGALTATPFAGDGKGRGYNVSLGPDFQNALNNFSSLSNNAAGQLGRLQSRLQPGFSDLRQAGVAALENNRTRTVGDLRDSLAQRRVLGSSFANDSISRAEAEFAQQQADFESRTLLQEVDATRQFIEQRSQLQLNAVQQTINALGLETNIAAALTTGTAANLTSMANINNQLSAQAAANNAAGLGSFFQPAIDAIGSATSSSLGNLLSGSGSSKPVGGTITGSGGK